MMAKIFKNLNRHLADFMEDVEQSKFPTNAEMRQGIDMVKAALLDEDVYVDDETINNAIEFIERYRPYKLAPPQRYIHAVNVGLRYRSTGELVFSEMLLLCARGFGKNVIASDEALYLVSNRNNIRNYNVEIVANNEEQAKTSYMDCYDTIKLHKNLQSAFKNGLEKIVFKKTNSRMKYHTSNARTKDGLRPGVVYFDELHEMEDYSNIKVFTSAMGKVPDPRIRYLTSDGYVRGKVLDDFKDLAKDLLHNKNYKEGMFIFWSKIEDINKWDDPNEWIKANPMLPYLKTLMTNYERDYKKAVRSKEMWLEFVTKRCNHPIEDARHSVASWEEILATNQEIPDLDGYDCIGGIDYSEVRDFTAVGLLFRKDGKFIWKHHTFIVEDSLKLRDFKFDFNIPKNEGLVTIVKEKVMSAEYLAKWFLEQAQTYNIKKIVADDFRLATIRETFEKYGLPIESIRSGYVTHNRLAPLIDKLFAENNIVFGDDRMMRWYTNNVYVDTDAKGNKSYKKIDAKKRKTDGFMAFVHAMSVSDELEVKEIIYSDWLRPIVF